MSTVNVFDSAFDGPVILTPSNVKNMSDETIQEIIDWMASTQASVLKPRKCPFCAVSI